MAHLTRLKTFTSSRQTSDAQSPTGGHHNTMVSGGIKRTKTIIDTTNTSKGFLQTGKTSGMRARNRSPDNDDAALVEGGDNSSDGSGKKGKMKRFTPMNQRRPKVIFFRDPNIIDEYKSIKHHMM